MSADIVQYKASVELETENSTRRRRQILSSFSSDDIIELVCTSIQLYIVLSFMLLCHVEPFKWKSIDSR